MFGRLLLLFTVVPAVELYLLIRLGQWIGAGQTVAIILITGSVGAFLAKREGLGVVRRLQQDTLHGLPPGDRIVEGLLVLVGGAFLITPGVLTDLTGLLLIMPFSRRFLAPRIKTWVTRKLLEGADVRVAEVRVHAGARRPRDPLRRPDFERPADQPADGPEPVDGPSPFPRHPVARD